MNSIELKNFVKSCYDVGLSPIIEGKHGLGKSTIIKQFADEHNMHCELLIMSLLDTSDLCGLPRSAEIGGHHMTVWSAPSWLNRIINNAWPVELKLDDLKFENSHFKEYVLDRISSKTTIHRGELNSLYCEYTDTPNDNLYLHTQTLVSYTKGRKSILFLDEMNRAPADVLQTSLQLVLDKRLNDHQLPLGTMVVAAVNPADGDYNTMELDPALADRFCYGTLEPDAKAWLDWARQENLAPVVRDFIAEHPDRIWYTSKDGKSSATPRSWHFLARTMAKIDQIPQSVQFQLMKGLIGQELASQFLAYFNNYFKVIKMDDIEAFIAKQSKKTTDIQKLGQAVNKLIKDQEAIQKHELCEQFYSKYIKFDDAQDAQPLIAFLSGLDIEILNGFLKNKKNDDSQNYMKLAKFDGILNNKQLFRSITSKIK